MAKNIYSSSTEGTVNTKLLTEFQAIIQTELLSFSKVVNNSFQRIDNRLSSMEQSIQSNHSKKTFQPTKKSNAQVSSSGKNTHCWYHKKFGIAATDCPEINCTFLADSIDIHGIPEKPPTVLTIPTITAPEVQLQNPSPPPTPGKNSKRRPIVSMDDLFGPITPSPKRKWKRESSSDEN